MLGNDSKLACPLVGVVNVPKIKGYIYNDDSKANALVGFCG